MYTSMFNMRRVRITKSDYVRRKRRALIRKTFYIMQYQFENEQQARNTTWLDDIITWAQGSQWTAKRRCLIDEQANGVAVY